MLTDEQLETQRAISAKQKATFDRLHASHTVEEGFRALFEATPSPADSRSPSFMTRDLTHARIHSHASGTFGCIVYSLVAGKDDEIHTSPIFHLCPQEDGKWLVQTMRSQYRCTLPNG